MITTILLGSQCIGLVFNRYGAIAVLLFYAYSSFGQGFHDRLTMDPSTISVLILGHSTGQIKGFGSGSLYGVPVSTNRMSIVSVVTALHNLRELSTGKPLEGIVVKLNMPPGSAPRYVKIPLKNNPPRNYWISPSGLDLAVIPVPGNLVQGSDHRSFEEYQIITAANSAKEDIVAGLVVAVHCFQPEYSNTSIDYAIPQNIPTIRMGHVSRMGFITNLNVVRNHIIDVHSSPGNSGATVVAWVPVSSTTSAPRFLGIVQGFYEESGSYKEYKARIAAVTERPDALTLVSANSDTTNKFAITIKTTANPDLTDVIPVHELVGMAESLEFKSAVDWLVNNLSKYEIRTALPSSSDLTK